MKVNTIGNCNNSNFGAKIKFENPNHRITMPNITDYSYAKKVLDKFEAYHPNDTVLIKLIKKTNKYDSCLEAVNLTSKGKMVYRLTPEDANKDFNDINAIGGCKTMYSLLDTLMDKTALSHNNFWGTSFASKSELLPSKHSIFNA